MLLSWPFGRQSCRNKGLGCDISLSASQCHSHSLQDYFCTKTHQPLLTTCSPQLPLACYSQAVGLNLTDFLKSVSKPYLQYIHLKPRTFDSTNGVVGLWTNQSCIFSTWGKRDKSLIDVLDMLCQCASLLKILKTFYRFRQKHGEETLYAQDFYYLRTSCNIEITPPHLCLSVIFLNLSTLPADILSRLCVTSIHTLQNKVYSIWCTVK